LRRPLLQRFADRPDCPLLVVAPGDAVRKGDLGKGLADLPAPDQGFELIFFVEALDLTGWVAQVIPDPVAVAVGEKDQRTPSW
jgi:hypothetical protein